MRLGEIEQQIMDQLRMNGGWMTLFELADEPRDRAAISRARRVVGRLERRYLVATVHSDGELYVRAAS